MLKVKYLALSLLCHTDLCLVKATIKYHVTWINVSS